MAGLEKAIETYHFRIGLTVRKYVLRKRGAIAHDTQHVPGAALNAAARTEVDHLLSRLARYDPLAAF
jgi:4-hydroxy-tetrahydrodipicolinate synthase